MRKATFFYLLRRGLLGAGGFVRDGLVMAASKFKLSGITHPSSGSAEFDGSSDYIDASNKHIENDLGITDAFTFGVWVNKPSVASYRTILSMYGTTSEPRIFWFGLSSAEAIHYNISLTGGDKSAVVSSVPSNEWAYLNVTYDGANIKTYIDGSLVGTLAATGTLDGRGYDPTENLLIGSERDGSYGFYDGNLANVAIWNRALSSDEINSVMWKGYDALEASEKSGLQAWYRLDDISGTSVPDSSGNGNNGTAY